MLPDHTSTIAAIATPRGTGGVGIVRLSGDKARAIAQHLTRTQHTFEPRVAKYHSFFDENEDVLDNGLVLFFPSPHSFTGEDVIELHGHGGIIVLDQLLKRVLQLGSVAAKPGEFSLRAFLNKKMDLLQCEAVADLISAQSTVAARSAVRSLTGVFSKKVHALVTDIIALRVYIEAVIDFPDEAVDFLSEGNVNARLSSLIEQNQLLLKTATEGCLLREGMKVVIAGKPNAGKSSLMNVLAKKEVAIVTETPGTTRDVLKEHMHVEGVPVCLVDTAGLRESQDVIEAEGIRRAKKEMQEADKILWVFDTERESFETAKKEAMQQFPTGAFIFIANKIDRKNEESKIVFHDELPCIYLSAKTEVGIELLLQHLNGAREKEGSEGVFMARQRHVVALENAYHHLTIAKESCDAKTFDCMAEELRLTQHYLNEITGEFSSDDLLGEIFSRFCIGK